MTDVWPAVTLWRVHDGIDGLLPVVTSWRVHDGIDGLLPAWRLPNITARPLLMTSLRTASDRDVTIEMKIKPQSESVKSTTTSDVNIEWDLMTVTSVAADLLQTVQYSVLSSCWKNTDWVKVLCPTQHRIETFFPANLLTKYWNKTKSNTTKAKNTKTKWPELTRKNTQTTKPK